MNLHQTLQTVVANDDATIEVVQVAGSETATIQGHQGTQLRRCDGEYLHNHPLRTVDTLLDTAAESLYHLQTLQRLVLALY